MQIIVVVCSKRQYMWGNIVENISRQTRRPDGVVMVYHKCPGAKIEGFINSIRTLGISGVEAVVGADDWSLPTMLDHAFHWAAPCVIDDGLLCQMDDDDWYGPGYLAEAEAALAQFPEAAIIGKYNYSIRWMDDRFTPHIAVPGPHAYPHPAPTVAGPTVSISKRYWHAHPLFRFDPQATWADVSIIDAAHRFGGEIYTTGPGEFFLQRYPSGHEHGWPMPDPVED